MPGNRSQIRMQIFKAVAIGIINQTLTIVKDHRSAQCWKGCSGRSTGSNCKLSSSRANWSHHYLDDSFSLFKFYKISTTNTIKRGSTARASIPLQHCSSQWGAGEVQEGHCLHDLSQFQSASILSEKRRSEMPFVENEKLGTRLLSCSLASSKRFSTDSGGT